MFSMKMKWLRFADSLLDLENKLGSKELVPLHFNNQNLLLIRHQGKYYLVKNKCPHQGIKLDNAKCENGYIVCPWHHYGFDLNSGRGAGLYLDNFPVEFRQDGVYAGFEYFSWF